MITVTIFYYFIINIIAFIMYGIDKRKAKLDRWRIPERILISAAVLGGAFGAYLGMRIFHHKTLHRKFSVTVPIFFVIHLFVIIAILWIAADIWIYGNRYDEKSADVAVVLGAATDGKEVSPVFRERINHAIKLYKNGSVKKIILTGGVGAGNEKSDAYIAEQYTLSNGVSQSDILIEERSSITEENLQYAKEIMDESGFTSALIVSDPLHMKRAMLMAGDYGIEAYSSPTQTSMYKSFRTKLDFMNREEFFYIGYLIVRNFR